jgi:PAS domain S-box-containing protein
MLPYGCAAGVSVVSVGVVAVLGLPLSLLLVPVVLVAYRGTLRPGLVALAVVVLGTLFLRSHEADRVVALAINGAMISFVIELLHRSRRQERIARLAEQGSQRRFQQLFHASPVALSLSSLEDGHVLEVNDAYLRTFGIRRSQILGRTPQDAGIQGATHAREQIFAALSQQGGSVEAEVDVTTAEGPRRLMLWSRVIELDGKPFALSTLLDITEQAQARAAAQASNERLRELAENVHEIFWVADPHTYEMQYVSPSYEKIFGRTCEQLYRDPREWIEAMHPEDRERIRAKSEQQAGEPWEDQYRILRPDGVIRTIHVAVSPIRDATGNVVRIAGVAEDVTEKLALEAQVRQTQKLESVGLLAGGVAHDFNNILAVVAANASLLAETMPQEGENAELVAEIESAVQRGSAMTRQLLAFSRKQVIEPIVLDLNAAVSDTRKMLRRMVGEDVSIQTSLEPELGRVLIDPGYLVQVLMNLAVNARDAMPRGGSLTISTRTLKQQNEVVLTVSDTGCGMPPEVKAHIFEPFFTTKDSGRGTGLGLSVVHGIVQQAGGRIEVESELGVGTTMRIFLPFVDAPAEHITDVAVIGAAGTEQILLVDDDMYVRVATSRALRARGYHVLEASDGHAALRMLADHADVKLLVTDVVMPGLDGRELVDAARARRPSLKVLYISGYTDDAVLRHGVKHAEVAILEKPFRGHTLVGKVRQILDAA